MKITELVNLLSVVGMKHPNVSVLYDHEYGIAMDFRFSKPDPELLKIKEFRYNEALQLLFIVPFKTGRHE